MYFWEAFLLHTVLGFHKIVINARMETGFELRQIGENGHISTTILYTIQQYTKHICLVEMGVDLKCTLVPLNMVVINIFKYLNMLFFYNNFQSDQETLSKRILFGYFR